MKLAGILCVLLALTAGGLLWQTQRHGEAHARYASLSDEMQHNRVVMDELRAMTADAREALAQLRASEQQRQKQGEIRREQIRKAIDNETCARTVVSAALSDSLQNRQPAPVASGHLRTRAGKPDAGDPRPAAESTGDLGRDRPVERSPARRAGHL